MKITAIEKAKGNRYAVHVDGGYWAILDAEILMRNQLHTEMDLDEEELDDLKRQAERRTARERAYYLLGYRDHSKKELYDKLLKSARPVIVREIIDLMEEQGYLDDERYAQKLARYYLESKKWGGRKAVFELTRKGIDRETAQEAVDSCAVDPRLQIRAVIERRYSDALAEGGYKGRQKVIAALNRMGYGYDDIKAAVAEYTSGAEEYEA